MPLTTSWPASQQYGRGLVLNGQRVPIRELVHVLGHTMCCLGLRLEQEVNQVKVSTGVVVPIPITFHVKSNGGRRGVRTGVLTSRVPGPVIRGKGLVGDNAMLESTTSKVLAVFEGHADDDEDSSWTTNFFYLPRSRTIPKVV